MTEPESTTTTKTAALKVLWPYITLRVKDEASGTLVLKEFYAGVPVPEGADPDDVERLVRKGALVEADSVAGEFLAVPAGTPIPGEPPNVEVTEQPAIAQPLSDRLARLTEDTEKAGKAARSSKTDDEAADADVDADGDVDADDAKTDLARPRANASKEDWVTYAVAHRGEGVSEADARAEAEARTKAELIDEFGA